jgi:DNA-binding CsgD family transcriptional regulator
MPEIAGIRPTVPAAAALAEHALELYDDLRLMPFLRQLMLISCRLTAAIGGSISIIEYPGQSYTKIAERGTACQLGHSFPLYEGVTGQVVACRRPVILDAYRDIATGHLPAGHPARDGAVAAIPIWWRGEVVGVNVVFAGCARHFTTAEIDQLEVLTQLAAPGITTAAGRELPLAHLGPPEPPPHRADPAQPPAQPPVQPPPQPSVAEMAAELVAFGERAGIYADSQGQRLNVAAAQSPFSPRERQVATLLARGLSDRSIAHELLISRKTVEKHVGAVLRKTGTPSRTAAVMCALDRGWLDDGANGSPAVR